MPAPQRGDYTGQQRKKLAEDRAAEIAKRQEEVGLVNQVDVVHEEEGVWDPSTGQMTELSPEAQRRVEELERQPVTVEDDEILDPRGTRTFDPMKDLQPTQTQQAPKAMAPNALEVQDLGPEPITVEEEWRVIRVNTDIEQMTYGVGNDLTFLRGRRYRVPRDLYDWLESRGVVYH
jgi:hypothetical protein